MDDLTPMTSKKEIVDAVVSAIEPVLTVEGFGKYVRGRSEFVRPTRTGDQRLGVDVYKKGGFWLLTFFLKVRLESVEQVRNRHRQPRPPAAEAQHGCTAVKRLDNLSSDDRPLDPIALAGAQEVAEVLPEIKDRLVNVALPWLDRYSDPGVLLEHARSTRGDWPIPTLLQRAEVLTVGFASAHDATALQRWLPDLREQLDVVSGPRAVESFDAFVESLGKEFPEVRR